jgi:5-methylcytosine-specific restriction enzyme A
MPARPLRPCTHPGCKVLTLRGKCDRHRKVARQEQDAMRGTTAERGYSWDWRRLRDAYLREHPLCECDECQAGNIRVTPAEVVNHRIDIAERPDLRLEWSNLQAMSKEHHDRYTARTRGWGRASRA